MYVTLLASVPLNIFILKSALLKTIGRTALAFITFVYAVKSEADLSLRRAFCFHLQKMEALILH